MEAVTETKQGDALSVPKGYKKTKVGWMPKDWNVSPISFVVCSIKSGVSVNSEDRTKYVNESGILKTSSVSYGVFIPDENKAIVSEDEFNRAKLNPIKDTLLISRMNTPERVGACAYVPETRDDLFIPDRLWLTSLDNNRANTLWLNFLLNSQKYRFYIQNRATGTSNSMKNISKESFLSISIPVPPLPEQQKIAKILSTWDKAIEQNLYLIEQLKNRKKGLMQQLLTGKTRLKGFGGEWKEVKLDDVATRLTAKNEELNDNVVTISAQRGFVKQEDFFKKRVASDTLSGYYLIEKGQFAYNKSYSNGYPMGAFKRLDTLDKAVVTTLYICFELKDNVDSDFMVNYFEDGLMIRNLMKIAQEGGRAHGLLNIALNDFFSLKLTVPSIEEQQAIAKVLTTADKEIKTQENYLQQLQDQKKGLMQQLLTGVKRVKSDEL